MSVSLETTVCGIRFKNPIVAASSPITGDAEHVRRAFEAGAGAVVMKSVSEDPRFRVAIRPMFTILQKRGYPRCFSNYSMGFASLHDEKRWLAELEQSKKYAEEYQGVVIGSIFAARTVDAWADLAKQIEDCGADMLELDLSCPNTSGSSAGVEQGTSSSVTAEITAAVVAKVSIPVFAKITADSVDPVGLAKTLKEAGAHGITAINRNPSLDVDLKTGRPLLAGGFTGVGGPWMRPIMLRWVARIVKEVDIPVSATNGIWSWEDVVKAIMCGASTVQTCTAVMFSSKGYGVITGFLEGLENYLKENNYNSVNQIRGITLPQIREFDTLDRREKGEVWAEVNQGKCTACGHCANVCFFDALFLSEDRKAYVVRENCEGCGLCVVLCPRSAIELQGEGPFYFGSFI